MWNPVRLEDSLYFDIYAFQQKLFKIAFCLPGLFVWNIKIWVHSFATDKVFEMDHIV